LKKRKEIFAQYEAGEGGNTVLVDSAQMRKSICYVVGTKVFPPKRQKGKS
jgi:hypothetical protein